MEFFAEPEKAVGKTSFCNLQLAIPYTTRFDMKLLIKIGLNISPFRLFVLLSNQVLLQLVDFSVELKANRWYSPRDKRITNKEVHLTIYQKGFVLPTSLHVREHFGKMKSILPGDCKINVLINFY